MLSQSQEVRRLSLSLLGSGALTLILGGASVVWPQEILLIAMLLTAAVAALFGVYQMGIALRVPHCVPEWAALLHGATLVGFGLLPVGLLTLPLRFELSLVALWLALYGVLMLALALAFWPMPRTRRALLSWAATNLVLAMIVVMYSGATVSLLLGRGAAYAAAFGAFQIVAGVWIRHVVVPRVQPTTQAGWLPLRAERR